MMSIEIRPVTLHDKDWVSQYIKDQWHSEKVVAHGVIYYPCGLPGFIAVNKKENIGLLTYQMRGKECEIITLNSLRPSLGIGTLLVEAVKKEAQKNGCRRLWLITTNDNLSALRFYQKRGFSLVSIHRNELERSRKLKPEIPLIGNDGIPLRDELELELILHDSIFS